LHAGNLVRANDDNPLVVINQIAPIFVSFGIPEKELGKIIEKNRGSKLSVEASVEEGSEGTHAGMLSVIDNTVDPKTGTIRLKAVFQNPDRALWPGQFVNVALTLERMMAVVIPAEAVQAGQEGSFVYVVKADQTVEPRPVTVGVNVGGKVIIESGLAVGDTVVTDGQSRLYPGATIQAAGGKAS
jgi:multidrug efflux system membrane fusion protein